MPYKPMRPCNYPGCPELTKERYCEKHKKQIDKEYDSRRETATQRGYNHRWHKIRNIKLNQDPLCERCIMIGHDIAAVLVHHKDRNPMNNTMSNLEALCDACHDKEHKDDVFKRRY